MKMDGHTYKVCTRYHAVDAYKFETICRPSSTLDDPLHPRWLGSENIVRKGCSEPDRVDHIAKIFRQLDS